MSGLKSVTEPGASGLQNFLGGAAVLGGLYKNIGGADGLSKLGSLFSGWGS
jgi:hypothetical protein